MTLFLPVYCLNKKNLNFVECQLTINESTINIESENLDDLFQELIFFGNINETRANPFMLIFDCFKNYHGEMIAIKWKQDENFYNVLKEYLENTTEYSSDDNLNYTKNYFLNDIELSEIEKTIFGYFIKKNFIGNEIENFIEVIKIIELTENIYPILSDISFLDFFIDKFYDDPFFIYVVHKYLDSVLSNEIIMHIIFDFNNTNKTKVLLSTIEKSEFLLNEILDILISEHGDKNDISKLLFLKIISCIKVYNPIIIDNFIKKYKYIMKYLLKYSKEYESEILNLIIATYILNIDNVDCVKFIDILKNDTSNFVLYSHFEKNYKIFIDYLFIGHEIINYILFSNEYFDNLINIILEFKNDKAKEYLENLIRYNTIAYAKYTEICEQK